MFYRIKLVLAGNQHWGQWETMLFRRSLGLNGPLRGVVRVLSLQASKQKADEYHREIPAQAEGGLNLQILPTYRMYITPHCPHSHQSRDQLTHWCVFADEQVRVKEVIGEER